MFSPRPRPIMLAAVLAMCSSPAPNARAQDAAPVKAIPQVVAPAPQKSYVTPQATVATPQPYASGQYASPQAYSPCSCYFPQGYCPFPRGYCAFPRGNCVAIRPTAQWPVSSSQFSTPQELSPIAPR